MLPQISLGSDELSPLSYPGGKVKCARYLASFRPKCAFEYREPFLGGGSMFVHARRENHFERYWLNDANPCVVAFWRQLQRDAGELARQLLAIKNSYEDGKDLYVWSHDALKSDNQTDIAMAFYILNRITFGGLGESGGYSPSRFCERFTEQAICKLILFQPLLTGVRITCEDCGLLMDDSEERVFVFADPPYAISNRNLYGDRGDRHRDFDQERFARIARESPHEVMITLDDAIEHRERFDGYTRIVREVQYSIGQSRKCAPEIVLINYNPPCANALLSLYGWSDETERVSGRVG